MRGLRGFVACILVASPIAASLLCAIHLEHAIRELVLVISAVIVCTCLVALTALAMQRRPVGPDG